MTNKIGHFVCYKIPGDIEKFGNKPGKFTTLDTARIIKRIGRPRVIVKEEHYRVYSAKVVERSTREKERKSSGRDESEMVRSLRGTVFVFVP